MDALLQRLTGFAAIPFVRDGDAPREPDRPALRIPPAARWALWVALLILPGSFLLLPLLLWGRISFRHRRLVRP